MKPLLIFACAILFLINGNTQTLRETEQWIASKIESNQFNIRDRRDADVSWRDITTEVDFSNSGYLFISEIRYFNSKNQPAWHRSYIIPVKYMKRVSYKYRKDYVEMEFGIKSNNSAGQNMILEEVYDGHGAVSESNSVQRFTIILGRSFLEDKVPNRFRKAVDHLIELNGGVAGF